MRGKKLTFAQRKTIVKFGKGLGITDKTVGDWLYKSMKYIDLSGEGLGKSSIKQEQYTLVHAKTNETLEVLCDILK